MTIGLSALQFLVSQASDAKIPFLSLNEVENGADSGIALTFDDGPSSLLEGALGFLDQESIPVTLFLCTDYLHEAAARWPDYPPGRARPIAFEEARSLTENPNVALGSHGHQHVDLRLLTDEALEDALSRSANDLRALGQHCLRIAWPFGLRDQRVLAAARGAGFRFAYSVGASPMKVVQHDGLVERSRSLGSGGHQSLVAIAFGHDRQLGRLRAAMSRPVR